MTSLRLFWGFVFLVLLASASLALPVVVEKVEIDDVAIEPNTVVRLNVERGKQFDIRVRVRPFVNLDNVEIMAFISGYEHNARDERLMDVSQLFDVNANISYVRTLRLAVPEDVEKDSYKIRLVVSDRFGDASTQDFNLLLDSKRHNIFVKDISVVPNNVVSGGAVLAVVRVDNKGQRTERDIRVEVGIPELGVSGVDYIDEVKSEREEETEEIFLKIPQCAKPGLYNVVVSVSYNDARSRVLRNFALNVEDSPSCGDNAVGSAAEKPAVEFKVSQKAPVSPQSVSVIKRSWLEIMLFVLVGLLALLGIVLALSKL